MKFKFKIVGAKHSKSHFWEVIKNEVMSVEMNYNSINDRLRAKFAGVKKGAKAIILSHVV